MKLKPVFNRRFGQWLICHDKWCSPGKSSIVATITTTGDDTADAKLAYDICEAFNTINVGVK